MHQRFLGIDIDRAPTLTSALHRVTTDAATAADLVLEAETRCEIVTGAVGPLDDLGRDCAGLATAVAAAVAELAAFRLPPIRRSRRSTRTADRGRGAGHPTAGLPADRNLAGTPGTSHGPEAVHGHDGEPAAVELGLDHLTTAVSAGAPGVAAPFAEAAEHERYLARLIDARRVPGPPIRLDPRFVMQDTRYWFTWAHHDVGLRRAAFVARARSGAFGGFASATRALGRISLVAGGALSIHAIYEDGSVAYTSSNGDAGATTIAVLRATAGEAIEWSATGAAGSTCALVHPLLGAGCAFEADRRIDGRGVELVDAYAYAVDDVADDLGLTNVADQRSLGERVRDLFDLTPWS